MQNLIVIPVLGAVGLLLALFVTFGIKRLPAGTVIMQEYLSSIENVIGAFINKHYIVAAGLILVVFFIIAFLFNLPAAISFLCGFLVTIFILNRVMDIIAKAGIRTTATTADKALAVMLCGSFVSAILVMAVVLLGCGLLFWAIGNPRTINLFLLGISMAALLYSTGSSIFRSTITSNEASYLLLSGSTTVDLFESCAVALAGAMTIGALGMVHFGFAGVILPLIIFSVGLIICIFALIYIIIYRRQGMEKVMGRTIFLYTLFLILVSLIVVRYLLPGEQLKVFLAVVLGLGSALLLFLPLVVSIPSIFKQDDSNAFWTRYYLVICIPVLLLSFLLSYHSAGFYGVSITGLAILLYAGIAVFIQSFAKIKFFATGLTAGVMDENDAPDENEDGYKETVATSFSVAATTFAAFILLLAFIQVARVQEICIITNGLVLLGLAIGGVLPYLFTSWVNNSAQQGSDDNSGFDNNDDKLEEEAVKQDSEVTKDYNIYTYRESLLVLLAAAAIPLLTGFLLGKQVLAALIIGTSIAGILLVIVRAKNYEPHLSILIKFLLILSLSIAAPLL
ncbi:MAG TPA: hypothetical protein DD791_05050 [Syntrophomonas sp.]|jgi:K(+)-stimulated pyrophosphate-energized sodium pump|nr:hypothetical protein [Syntrophomonas sp.]